MYQIQCPACFSRHVLFTSNGIIVCPYCHGWGKIYPIDREEFTNCPDCNDGQMLTDCPCSGSFFDDPEIIESLGFSCLDCEDTKQLKVECSTCHGTNLARKPKREGRSPMKCTNCNGERMIYLSQGGWDPDPQPVQCPRCDGTGAEPCRDCEGKHFVPLRPKWPLKTNIPVRCHRCGGSGFEPESA